MLDRRLKSFVDEVDVAFEKKKSAMFVDGA